MLSKEQVTHFETFGFLVLRNVLSRDEVDIMIKESEEIFSELRQGKSFTAQEREAVQPFFERKPFLHSLLADDRVYSIGESILGSDFMLVVTEGNLHVGDTPWHAGEEARVLRTVKIGFYLEPLTINTGSLRVIPGTHKMSSPDHFSILKTANKNSDFMPFGVSPKEIPSYPIESDPGDLIVFTESVVHAAFGGRDGRHQHAINFCEYPKSEDLIAFTKDWYSRTVNIFRPPISNINSDNARLRRMSEGWLQLGFEPVNI